MTIKVAPYFLFGASKPWGPPSWTTTDDRIRGGASQSYLRPLSHNRARFYGHLDFSTLGGAGFASQFSPPGAAELVVVADSDDDANPSCWDLSAYDGLEIEVGEGDRKVYTLIVKDETPAGQREDGREKAGISWEAEFQAAGKKGERDDAGGAENMKVWVPWGDFRATYRGREKEGPGELKNACVRRVGFMMRSNFGKQEGDFSIELISLSARKAGSEKRKSEL